MKKEMLINVLQPEESRIAIVEDGVLEELYVERSSAENYVGNIYKGRVVNIEPSIQAAFVDFGVGRNGFLHVSDVEYQYYRHLVKEGGEDDREQRELSRGGPPPKHLNERNARNKPPIQKIFQRGLGAGAGDQGGDWQQGANSFDVYFDSWSVSGTDAGVAACGGQSQD